ncbi:MAG: GNAT family N-acetyltransferase [Pseudomonadota bacterium]
MIQIQSIPSTSIDQIEPLWCALTQHHADLTNHFHSHYETNSFAKRRAALLTKDQLAIFGAFHEQQLVGFALCSVTGEVGEIDSLYVESAHRGNDLGARLMNKSIKWLRETNCHHIRLAVGDGNEQVMSFYKSLGFEVRAYQMELID